MIRFVRNGVHIDGEGWTAANPRHDRVEVFFPEGVNITVTEDFLRQALDLIEWARNRRVTPSNSEEPR